ncbi:MAG TPA: hypothetical protein VK509_01970, partial [Polyangiales bacterium]|nr:hypothetical protein [Polyangiales bacterium]
GYADACDQVLWSDVRSIEFTLQECATGSSLETWLEIYSQINGQTRNVRVPLLAAGSFYESIAANASVESRAATSTLMTFADLSTKVRARVEPVSVDGVVFTAHKAGSISINTRTVVRYALRGAIAESCDATGAYKMTGSARWEIRGY